MVIKNDNIMDSSGEKKKNKKKKREKKHVLRRRARVWRYFKRTVVSAVTNGSGGVRGAGGGLSRGRTHAPSSSSVDRPRLGSSTPRAPVLPSDDRSPRPATRFLSRDDVVRFVRRSSSVGRGILTVVHQHVVRS